MSSYLELVNQRLIGGIITLIWIIFLKVCYDAMDNSNFGLIGWTCANHVKEEICE